MRRTALVLLVCLLATALTAKEKFQQPGPVQLDRDGEKWAEKTLKKMTLEQKVGQLFIVWSWAEFQNVNSAEFQRLRDIIHKYHVGGFGLAVRVDGPFLLRNQPYEAAMMTNLLQRESEIPLIFAADFERGLDMRLHGTTRFPHAMAFGAAGKKEYAREFGRITGVEARAIGVHWNWFPVADVNSNPANPIINTRAFGEDPQQVADLVAEYIAGAHQAGMLTTAKHFPGHGDTDTDTHLAVARVGGDRARLEAVELPAFRRAIHAGVDSVMVAHVAIPALEPDPNRVATISRNIVTGLLKEEMKFKGIIVTDALDMGALTSLFPPAPGANPAGRAAVEAFKAGNDLLLIPSDFEGAYRGVLEAARSGEIPIAQIDQSVLKLLKAKASVGLHEAKFVDIEALPRVVAQPQHVALGETIAADAVTLVRENRELLPLRASAKSNGTGRGYVAYKAAEGGSRLVAVVFTDDARMEAGRVLERELKKRVPDVPTFFVDPKTAGPLAPVIMQAVDKAEAVIAAVYVVPSSYKTVVVNGVAKNTVSLVGPSADLLQQILAAATIKTAVVALGNPYLASDFPSIENYMCTFSSTAVSELSAVRALFGEIPVRGRLPVTIPNVAARGSGLDRVVQSAAVTR